MFGYAAQLIAVVGSGVLAQAIGTAFDGAGSTVWLSQVIVILICVLSPPVSQLADYWGRKWILMSFNACSFVGAIVASRAQSMGAVIAGFAIIGFGCGAQPLWHAVSSEVMTRRQRPIAQMAMNMGVWIGTIVGICMGSALLRSGNVNNYRIYLYITAGIYALSILGLWWGYHPPPREVQKSLTTSEKLHRLDWLGIALSTPGLVLFCVALAWSRNPYPWSDPRVLATFIVAIGLLTAFVIYEWRFKKDGILHHDLFRTRNFALGLGTIFAEGLSFFAVNSYFIYQVVVFTQDDAFIAGIHYLVVYVVAILVGSALALYMARSRTIRLPGTIGFGLILAFFICMATATPSTPAGVFWGYPVILGAGFGGVNTAIFVAVQLSTPPDMISTASALVIAFRSLGGVVGLAINNAIYNDSLSSNVGKKIAAATLPLGLPPSSLGALIAALTTHDDNSLAAVPGVTSSIIAAAERALVAAFGVAFRNAWIASASFMAVATASKSPLCLCQPDPRYTKHGILTRHTVVCFCFFDPKEEFNQHIDASVEKGLSEPGHHLEPHSLTSTTDVRKPQNTMVETASDRA